MTESEFQKLRSVEDRLTLLSRNIPAITSTHSALTFKFKKENEIFIVTLSNEVGESGDITDYLAKLNNDPEELFNKSQKSLN
ncbi:MAG TPA: hypothetical protein PKV22_04575 [Paludibacteraceae bacterium]|nr:hypothetical protein [Paludibacteraceae bacterium]